MSTSRIPALRAALKTAIAAQLTTDGITAVTNAFHPADEQTKKDHIWLGSMSSSQTEHAFGGSREETITVNGAIEVFRAGTGDTVGTAAETAAHAILGSIEDALRADIDVNSTVFDCVVAGHESEVQAVTDGWYGVIGFDLEAEAHI